MKLSNQELETLVLSHISKNSKSMDKLLARGVTKDHFDHILDGDKVSFTSSLFKLIHDYWAESGGLLFTTLVLESKLDQFKVSDKVRSRLFNLWTEVQDADVDDNDFHELVTRLKDKRCHKLLSDMLFEINDKYSTEGIKTTIDIINNSLDNIQKEKNELAGDRHNFDITESGNYFKEEHEKRINHPELFKGINCGISNIDEKTFGWLPGQIIVFLAPSSGGKSVMLLNSAMHANRECNKKVLYMSFEMNSWLCLLRHVSLQFEIPYSQLKDNNLSPDELKTILDGLNASQGKAYFEYDVNMEDPTPEYIDSRIRDLIATKGKPDLLVVDYIGNMTVRNAPNNVKDWELQSKAIQQLFIMAKRYNIPILTAQQINRETIRDSRKSKEANKFMSYDQAAASGGQNLMHLCTYAIAMEPNREKQYCILHPVKMRDAWFHPFPIRMDSEFNKVREMSMEEQQTIMALHSIQNGSPISTANSTVDKSGKTPLKSHITDEDDEGSTIDFEKLEKEEIDLADWVLAQ